MKRYGWLLGAVAGAAVLAGCVERRYVVTSDPPGALVLRNGEPLGASPADDHFTYYGNYHFTLIRDGYETLEVDERIRAPWYEWPPLDFVSENLVPWWIYDVRHFHYALQPLQVPRSDEVLQRAEELRGRGQQLQPLHPENSTSGKPPATPVQSPPGPTEGVTSP